MYRGRWVRATPAFDKALCERVGLKPLEFEDAPIRSSYPFDPAGRRYMEYLQDRGAFADVPVRRHRGGFPYHLPLPSCGGKAFSRRFSRRGRHSPGAKGQAPHSHRFGICGFLIPYQEKTWRVKPEPAVNSAAIECRETTIPKAGALSINGRGPLTCTAASRW